MQMGVRAERPLSSYVSRLSPGAEGPVILVRHDAGASVLANCKAASI